MGIEPGGRVDLEAGRKGGGERPPGGAAERGCVFRLVGMDVPLGAGRRGRGREMEVDAAAGMVVGKRVKGEVSRRENDHAEGPGTENDEPG